MRLLFFYLCIHISLISVFSQASEALEEPSQDSAKKDYFALGNYSPLDVLIPSKFGLTLGYAKSADKTWEFEYLRGSLSVPFVVQDLGKMTDQRLSMIARSYVGGSSFNFNYGLSYFDFSIHLGDALLSRVSGGNYPDLDLVQIQSLGFNFGLGNRWSLDHNITLGVDWISWAQPLFLTNKKSAFNDFASNQQDRDDVDKAIKLISYFPRLSFFKIQIGMRF